MKRNIGGYYCFRKCYQGFEKNEKVEVFLIDDSNVFKVLIEGEKGMMVMSVEKFNQLVKNGELRIIKGAENYVTHRI